MKKIDDELIASIEEDRRKEWLLGVREFIARKKADKASSGGKVELLPLPGRTKREKVWVGPNYPARRIFVLGESWYGEYPDDLVTDDGYIRAYLDGDKRAADPMYTRIANACETERRQFWEGVMFTNFVQCVGETRKSRPTPKQYEAAKQRLEKLLEKYKPAGVWIIGIEQSKYSALTVERAEIPYVISPHTASFGLTNAKLGDGWKELITKVAGETK